MCHRLAMLVVIKNNCILLHFNTIHLFILCFSLTKKMFNLFGSIIGWSVMAALEGSQTIRPGMTDQMLLNLYCWIFRAYGKLSSRNTVALHGIRKYWRTAIQCFYNTGIMQTGILQTEILQTEILQTGILQTGIY